LYCSRQNMFFLCLVFRLARILCRKSGSCQRWNNKFSGGIFRFVARSGRVGGMWGGGRWNIWSDYTTHLGTAVACCCKLFVFEHLPTNAWSLLRRWVPVWGSQILSSSRTLWRAVPSNLPAWWGMRLFFPPCYHCIWYFLPLLSYCSQIRQAKKHVMNTDSVKVYAKASDYSLHT
jgi:hypothetical protein